VIQRESLIATAGCRERVDSPNGERDNSSGLVRGCLRERTVGASKKHILQDSTSKGHSNYTLSFPRHLKGPDKIQWKKDDYDVR
jgi:hypothetical protein